MSNDMVLQGQSDPIKLRVLVIGYDHAFLASVSEFLHLLNHQVWTYRNPFIAFSALRVRRNFYDLIITDLYLPEMDGFEVQKRVREEFKLPLIMVSSDDREQVILKALKLGAVHYIVKPVCFNDVKDLWNYVVVANKSRKEIGFAEEIESVGEQSGETALFDGNTTDDDHAYDKANSKRKRSAKEGNAAKKAKVVWTQELQARFLESVHFIGLEKAVPKTILEVMNVEGLTRENVASHLQKYRQFLRRVAARISLSKSDPMDKSKMPIRSTFRHSTRPSIFQQQRPLYGQILGINRSNPLIRGANDHVVSASNSVPSLGYRSQPFLPNSQYQAPEPASFIGYSNSTFPPANCNLPSINGFGFQANNVQSNWSTIPRDIPFTSGSNANNGLEAQAISASLPNNLCGTYNNYGTIAAPGLQYNDYFINSSWNGTLGFVNGSNNLIINHNNNGGIPITSVASVGLAGMGGNPNPNPMVFNGDDWPNSSTSGVKCTNFVGLFLNQNEHHQNMDDNVSLADNLMFGPDDFSGIQDSSSVGFDGVANLDTAGSTSNVFDNASSKHLQDEDFGILHDILYDDNNLDIVNQKEEIPAVNSEMNQENASLNKECNDQNSNRELVEEPEFDWLDLLDPNTIIENVSMDEEWEHFMDSFDY